jgi:hypothetical protein
VVLRGAALCGLEGVRRFLQFLQSLYEGGEDRGRRVEKAYFVEVVGDNAKLRIEPWMGKLSPKELLADRPTTGSL